MIPKLLLQQQNMLVGQIYETTGFLLITMMVFVEMLIICWGGFFILYWITSSQTNQPRNSKSKCLKWNEIKQLNNRFSHVFLKTGHFWVIIESESWCWIFGFPLVYIITYVQNNLVVKFLIEREINAFNFLTLNHIQYAVWWKNDIVIEKRSWVRGEHEMEWN